MWHMLEKITEQVTKYTTFLGQLWYIMVFVFRLIVVVTIGGAVYGDEQSSFKCSTDVVGCENICYNEFAKVSHMRFWAFQLLAVATPTVLFHFYTLYVSGEIEKVRQAEARLRAMEEGDNPTSYSGDPNTEKHLKKMTKRKKSIGHVKLRQIYSGNELKDVIYTNKIHYVYHVSVVTRMVLEAIFIYLGYLLFLNMNPDCKYKKDDPFCPESRNPLFFIWINVPASYRCRGSEGSDVYSACTMHVKDDGYVPCFVSRPYEKTVFLCYMGVLSGLCFLVSALELVLIASRKMWKKNKPHRRHHRHERGPKSDAVFYNGNSPTAPSKNYYDDHWTHNYPSLGVPIRIANRYEDPEKHYIEKTVRINDEDHNSVKHETNKDDFSDN